jgi:anaerobic magnesium-protoporphyrin IX monomethyl ester cyclase
MQLRDEYIRSCHQRDLESFLAAFSMADRRIRQGSVAEGLTAQADGLQDLGLFDWAIRNYRQAIADHPDFEPAYKSLRELYARLGLYYSEMALLRRLLQRHPGEESAVRRIAELEGLCPYRTVTFYLPCYNVEKYIAAALDGVLAQSYPIDEILIIDDGSTDRSMAIANHYPATIITHEKNKGLAAARNMALHTARGEFLATVDTDAVPHPFWLERLMLAVDRDGIAGVGGKLVEKNTATVVDRWRQVRMRQDHGDRNLDDVILFGSNTVFSVAALKGAGGYWEILRTNSEDVYISKLLLSKGYKTRYVPEAVCYHNRIDTLQSAVDTCYNWRKSFFEAKGAYENLGTLLEKSLNGIDENIGDLAELINHKQFELLYPSFLGCIRTVFKDLHRLCKESPLPLHRETLKAAYVLLFYFVQRARNIKPGAREAIREGLLADLADLVSVLFGREDEEGLAGFNLRLKQVVSNEADINRVIARLGISADVDLNYVIVVMNRLNPIFGMKPVVYAMIATSLRRIRHEAELSPYRAEQRVMLLNPPWSAGGRRGVRAGSRWPYTAPRIESADVTGYMPYPFFLGYLSSLLSEKGIVHVVVDAIAEEMTDSDFIERVAGYEPDIILMEVATASYVIDTLWLLKIRERLPGVKVIWAGTHATVQGERILKENPLVDFIVQGEYEKAALDLVECLQHGGDYSRLDGLFYRNASGEVMNSGQAELMNLDDLPLPERLALPIYKYNDLFAGMVYPSLQVHASRGCPYGCIYCVWPQVLYGGRKYRVRRPRDVAREIRQVVDEFGFESFYFDDDTFNIGKERILALCDEMKRAGLNLPWGIMARADTMDYEMLKAMKEAGLVGIKLGVESGSQSLVDAAEKGLDLAKVRTAVEWCRELGVRTHLTFTFGLPGETRETIEQTIAFAKEMNPDSIQFSITTPFPGTKYFDVLKERGHLLTEEWEKYDGGLYTVIRSDALSKDDLEAAVERANCEFWSFKSRACQ